MAAATALIGHHIEGLTGLALFAGAIKARYDDNELNLARPDYDFYAGDENITLGDENITVGDENITVGDKNVGGGGGRENFTERLFTDSMEDIEGIPLGTLSIIAGILGVPLASGTVKLIYYYALFVKCVLYDKVPTLNARVRLLETFCDIQDRSVHEDLVRLIDSTFSEVGKVDFTVETYFALVRMIQTSLNRRILIRLNEERQLSEQSARLFQEASTSLASFTGDDTPVYPSDEDVDNFLQEIENSQNPLLNFAIQHGANDTGNDLQNQAALIREEATRALNMAWALEDIPLAAHIYTERARGARFLRSMGRLPSLQNPRRQFWNEELRDTVRNRRFIAETGAATGMGQGEEEEERSVYDTNTFLSTSRGPGVSAQELSTVNLRPVTTRSGIDQSNVNRVAREMELRMARSRMNRVQRNSDDGQALRDAYMEEQRLRSLPGYVPDLG